MSLYLNSVTLSIIVQLPEHVFARHLPASPTVVGEALAEQISTYVQAERLGYYPALDYFRAQPGVLEPELLDAAENIAWFTCNQARNEIQRKLRPVFSSLRVQGAQALAFTMPAVRPAQANARRDLIRHFTPDTAKLVLQVNSFQKSEQTETMAKWASHLAYRWLKDSFARIEVISAQPSG